jgi:Zn-finger nucleic acid-binding protein
MNCEEVENELANGAVAAHLREALDAHIGACPKCRGMQRFYTDLDRMLKRAPVWNPPAGFAAGVAARAGARPASRDRVHRVHVQRPPDSVFSRFTVMIEGPLWVLRQYWSILFGSSGLLARR